MCAVIFSKASGEMNLAGVRLRTRWCFSILYMAGFV